MKNRMRKKILLTGMLCAMSVAAACGGTDAPQNAQTRQEELTDGGTGDGAGAAGSEAGDGVNVSEGGTGADAGTTGGGADAAQDDTPAAGDVPAAWSDTSPDLEGDIRELQDGKIMVAEAVTETLDDGVEMAVAAPDSADDSEFNKVTVTYDENTLFAVQTIYDGGARAEVSEASAADLAEGQLITVWGTSQGTEWAATQICIVKVE